MIILDTTIKTIEVILAAGVTTNHLQLFASYVDVTTTTYLPIAADSLSNNTTPVALVAAPASNTQRQVKLLTVFNADTVPATVTVRLSNGGTIRILKKVTLAVGSTLEYTDGKGFRVTDANGNVLSSSAVAAPAAHASSHLPSGSDPLTVGLGAPGGRLTLTSGEPITSADVTAAGTLYYTPAVHHFIWLYNGAVWLPYAFPEISLAVSLASGKLADVFGYLSGGALALELSAPWTNDSTPVDALAWQNGYEVKASDHTRLWLGTVGASGANVLEDSVSKRYVCNRYNYLPRQLRRLDSTSSWTYSVDAWHQARGNAANQCAFIACRNGWPLIATVLGQCEGSATGPIPTVAAALDSTTVPDAACLVCGNKLSVTGVGQPSVCSLKTYPARGRHDLVWLEKYGSATGTGTWYGANSGLQTGIDAQVLG